MSKTILIKILILATIAALPYFSDKTFALAEHDCDVISGDIKLFTKQVFSGKVILFSDIYPEAALEKAVKNLTAFCCKNILKQGQKPDPRCKDNSLPTSNYPESPYLFDHLIDVGLRRLDVLKNYSDISADPTGKAWRDFIAGVATNPDTTVPTKITDEYKKYRTIHQDRMFKKTHLKIENMETDERGKLEEFLKQYNVSDTVSLADKYNNICRIARNMYDKKPGNKEVIGGDKLSKGRSYYTDCQAMVARRINQENLYVKAILIDKATKMLQDNRETVLVKQFAQDKLAGLQNTITTIKNLMQTLVRQAPYCKKCSK